MKRESRLVRWIWWAVVVTAFFLVGFSIGWLAKRSNATTNNHKALSKYLKEFMNEIQTDQIREHLRKFTRLPHLAGTEQNLKYAQQIMKEWQDFGLDSVEMVPYDILLSYPNKSQPNYISIVDHIGNEEETSSRTRLSLSGHLQRPHGGLREQSRDTNGTKKH
ncbi:hypothetical protein XENOCAPTIV_029757 [Xenoophorus captivus]|uniref:Uncharacterized protein n=1 Tax=Xenoophorus captivus TaxID=1517983 RepID=A0ABV0S5A3_9TELE